MEKTRFPQKPLYPCPYQSQSAIHRPRALSGLECGDKSRMRKLYGAPSNFLYLLSSDGKCSLVQERAVCNVDIKTKHSDRSIKQIITLSKLIGIFKKFK